MQVDGDGLAWIVGGDGSAAYDVSDPLKPKMVMRTDENITNSGQLGFPGPDPVFGIGGKGETPIDLIHHDSLRFHKKSRRGFEPKAGKTYPAGGTGKVVGIVEEDYNRPDLRGSGQLPDLGHHRPAHLDGRAQARAPRPVRDGAPEPRRGARLGAGDGPLLGALLRRARRPRGGRLVRGGHALPRRDATRPASARSGYWAPTKGETWSVLFAPTDPSGSIVYALDFARGIDVLRFDRSDQRHPHARRCGAAG